MYVVTKKSIYACSNIFFIRNSSIISNKQDLWIKFLLPLYYILLLVWLQSKILACKYHDIVETNHHGRNLLEQDLRCVWFFGLTLNKNMRSWVLHCTRFLPSVRKNSISFLWNLVEVKLGWPFWWIKRKGAIAKIIATTTSSLTELSFELMDAFRGTVNYNGRL